MTFNLSFDSESLEKDKRIIVMGDGEKDKEKDDNIIMKDDKKDKNGDDNIIVMKDDEKYKNRDNNNIVVENGKKEKEDNIMNMDIGDDCVIVLKEGRKSIEEEENNDCSGDNEHSMVLEKDQSNNCSDNISKPDADSSSTSHEFPTEDAENSRNHKYAPSTSQCNEGNRRKGVKSGNFQLF